MSSSGYPRFIELQKVRDQQATDSGLLYRTAANVQNTASTATNLNAKLAQDISTQLAKLTSTVNLGFARIDEDLHKSFRNQTLIYDTMNRRHQAYEQRFASIEARLARPQRELHSPQPRTLQPHTVPLLEQAAAGIPPPPPPPRSGYCFGESPSPSPHGYYRPPHQGDDTAGKAAPPKPFKGKQSELEGWILQMEDFFLITNTRREDKKLAFIGLCTE